MVSLKGNESLIGLLTRSAQVFIQPGQPARVLVEKHGFTLRLARVFDMFPHTHHIESLALFTRD